ncbi:uncharacterized protein LOC122892073 [Neovison vison]|uniref:uncharacterized protein LOC122892073 n=1 Tax=Neovison vison TaxID=452646 RepID=UPI001CF0893B|nr:uncharacterized protein LOC122892073 [Neogale vison]
MGLKGFLRTSRLNSVSLAVFRFSKPLEVGSAGELQANPRRRGGGAANVRPTRAHQQLRASGSATSASARHRADAPAFRAAGQASRQRPRATQARGRARGARGLCVALSTAARARTYRGAFCLRQKKGSAFVPRQGRDLPASMAVETKQAGSLTALRSNSIHTEKQCEVWKSAPGLIEQVTTLGSDTGTLHTAEHWKYLQALLGILQKLPPLFCFLIRTTRKETLSGRMKSIHKEQHDVQGKKKEHGSEK